MLSVIGERSPRPTVPGEELAEWLLGVVTSPARAEAIVGDLTQQATEHSTAWFWLCTLRIAAASARQNLFSLTTQEIDMPGGTFGFLVTLWRHKGLLATCLLVSVIGTRIALTFYPARYRSQTSILVVPQRIPESFVHPTVTTTLTDRLNTITQQILSRTRLERIANEYDLYSDARTRDGIEDVVQRMRNDIHPQVIGHDAFRISFDGSEPRTVQRVTQRLAALFVEENLNERASLAASTSQFLEAQAEEIRRRLDENETAINARNKSGYRLSTAERIEYDVLQERYRDFLLKRQTALLSTNLERRQIGEQFKLLETAQVPTEPITPNRKAATGAGAAAGLCFGVALIGITTRRRRSVDADPNAIRS